MSERRMGEMIKCLEGATLQHLEQYEHGWTMRFDNGALLNVESLWRLVGKNMIVVTSEDDRQQFGLPKPIDAAEVLRGELHDKRVRAVEVDPPTADLMLKFDNGLQLVIVNTSSGYEAWTLRCDGQIIVGRNGSE